MNQPDDTAPYAELIEDGLTALSLKFSDLQRKQCLIFLTELKKWNQAYNLTAIDTWPSMITLHLLDSLTVIPYIQGQCIIDIGTGAGLPGIPLAIALPDKQFTLVDSNGKKVRFIRHVVRLLKLKNVQVIHSRAEDLSTSVQYDVIIARALSSLSTITAITQHVLQASGEYLLMKGIQPEEEIAQVRGHVISHQVRVPGLDAERHIIQIKDYKGAEK